MNPLNIKISKLCQGSGSSLTKNHFTIDFCRQDAYCWSFCRGMYVNSIWRGLNWKKTKDRKERNLHSSVYCEHSNRTPRPLARVRQCDSQDAYYIVMESCSECWRGRCKQTGSQCATRADKQDKEILIRPHVPLRFLHCLRSHSQRRRCSNGSFCWDRRACQRLRLPSSRQPTTALRRAVCRGMGHFKWTTSIRVDRSRR